MAFPVRFARSVSLECCTMLLFCVILTLLNALGGLCVIVAFPGYPHIYLYHSNKSYPDTQTDPSPTHPLTNKTPMNHDR